MDTAEVVVASDYCLRDVWAVLPDRVVERATIVVEDGLIVSVVADGSTSERVVSGHGAVCIPGIVDLDSSAAIEGPPTSDTAITTQHHEVVLDGSAEDDTESLLCSGLLHAADAPVERRALLRVDPAVSPADATTSCVRACSSDAHELLVAVRDNGDDDAPDGLLDWLTIQAVARRVRLFVDRPDTPDDVDRAVEWGATGVLLPLTMDAARRAHERGLAVIAAAQAVVEPTDPPSEVSPLALIELGLCDALASGSRPNALLDAMSLLVLRGVRDLRGAVELVTAGPAAAAGLHDRGRLTPGCRADIALLRPHRERFHVDRAFRAGRRAASAAIS